MSGGGDPDAPSAASIRPLDSTLIYLPDQSGGNFHYASVRVRNTSDKVAVHVGGQLSIKDTSGQPIKSVAPTPINLLPGQEGVLAEEALDLPRGLKDGTVDAKLSVDEFRERPSKSPVSISGTNYLRGECGGCKITGMVANTFTRQKKDLQLRAIGLNNSMIVTGGFTYVEELFPKQDATFEIDITGKAACPPKVDKLIVTPKFGEDKIFSP